MKNIPNKIFIQIGTEHATDFKKLQGVTFSTDNIHGNDIEYTRNKPVKDTYEQSVKEYVDLFSEKHDMEFTGWAGDMIGTICFLNDYFFDFYDMRLDIDSGEPKESIIEWYIATTEEGLKCNYKSWVMGYKNIYKKGQT